MIGARDARGAPLEPDILLPEQFLMKRRGGMVPERLLMLAVLEDGIACFQKYAGARDAEARRLFDEAREWIESADRSALFAFERICEALDLHPEYLRRRLRTWSEHRRGSRRTTTVRAPRPVAHRAAAPRRCRHRARGPLVRAHVALTTRNARRP